METTTQKLWSLRSNEKAARSLAEKLRAKLAQQASDGTWLKTVQRTLHELAEAEAAAGVYEAAADFVEYADDKPIHQWAFEVLEAGADDTWSGRGNDFQRVVYDAKREALRRVVSIANCWGE